MTTPGDAARYLAKEAGIPTNGHAPPFTDLGNAERLVGLYGSDLLYCHDWKKWLAWDGTRFSEDRDGEVYRRATLTVRNMYDQGSELAAQAVVAADEKEAVRLSELSESIQKHARKSEERRRIESLIALAQSRDTIPVLPPDLDKDGWLLNCPNGTIDLRTGQLKDHNKSDRITKTTAVKYDPGAECPLWEGFLELVLGGDAELIRFIQQAVGYSLTGTVGDQVMFVLYGTGRNGKSTFLETLMAILGDYATKAPSDLLMVKRGEVHPTEKTVLYGARFVPAVETEEGRRLNETSVKELTGGDTIQARRMHENFWRFLPTHHLWLATNHKPMIFGTDLGIWRRIRLVPFAVTIADEDEDTAFPEKLKAEWPGILAWAVRGCLEWQEVGLQSPAAVQEATAEYRTSMDIIGDFLEEVCIIQEGTKEPAAALYGAFQSWAKTTGEKIIRRVEFGEKLALRGPIFKKRGAKGQHYWHGLHLTSRSDVPIEKDLFENMGDIGDEGDIDSDKSALRDGSIGPKGQKALPYVTHRRETEKLYHPGDIGDIDLGNHEPSDPWNEVGDDIDQLDL